MQLRSVLKHFVTLQKTSKFIEQMLLESPPSWGFDVPLATALCKTFLLRMLDVS
jgi:hypothetical protein